MNFFRKLTLITLCLVNIQNIHCQTPEVDHWETVIFAENDWKYFVGTSEPDPTWNEIGFDDSSWLTGKGGIGFGDGDDSTIIPQTTSLYLRKSFTLADASEIVHSIINADYDDGFVAYINGYEITRDNIGEVGIPPNFDELASTHKEAIVYTGEDPVSFFSHALLLKNILQNGTNVFSVQVHNSSSSSSDLSAIFYLSFGLKSSTALFSTPPTWFSAPTVSFSTSQLPIIEINTNNQAIDPDDRIVGDMGIIYNGAGNSNSFGGTYNEFDGKISLEYRGQSSLEFDKKSISFETQDTLGENLNVELLGLPKENDWVLYAPYSDKSLIRNVLTFKLHENMGHYAPRFRFCELMINNDYQGVYVLTEKIKRDKNRVDISKLSSKDTIGEDLTGGYIIKIDKDADLSTNAWQAAITPFYFGWDAVKYQYHYPKTDDIQEQQKLYIQDYVNDFDLSLKGSDFADPINGYRPFIDVNSFLDFMLITELSKDIDSYRYSTYLYKQKENKGGKLVFGPIWDFNTGYGNSDYSTIDAEKTSEWLYDKNGDKIYWFDRMIQDSVFANELHCRWEKLRAESFNSTEVLSLIDSLTDLLQVPQQRNFYRWDILNKYVWPNNFVGETYQEEVDYLKDWVVERMEWIDDSIPGTCLEDTVSNSIYDLTITNLEIFPNPNSGDFRIRFDNPEFGTVNIEIFDMTGKSVFTMNKQNKSAGFITSHIQAKHLSKGLYQVQIIANQTMLGTQKLMIR